MPKKLSLRPVHKTEEQELESFIKAAHANDSEHEPVKPWDQPHVRDDVMVMVSLRLPEPYVLKLRYISEKSRVSQQALLRDLVLEWIDQEIGKL